MINCISDIEVSYGMLNYRDNDKFSIHRTALVATYTALIDVVLALSVHWLRCPSWKNKVIFIHYKELHKC